MTSDHSPLTWTLRPPDVPEGRWRLCSWPFCGDGFDAAAPREGWGMAPLSDLLLCPAHRAAGHVPNKRYLFLQTATLAVPLCECEWEGDPERTLELAVKAWQGHVREAASRGSPPDH
jgi:hypothetical protein